LERGKGPGEKNMSKELSHYIHIKSFILGAKNSKSRCDLDIYIKASLQIEDYIILSRGYAKSRGLCC
jgi:hypothetical protein